MARPTRVLIHQHSFQHNFQQLRALVGECSIMAMIKANAYGHGIVQAASQLPNANAFGVACLEEAVALRKMNITQPIVLMEGVFDAEELQEVVRLQLHLVVHHAKHLELLARLPAECAPIYVWMKINTGMHRLGFAPDEFHAAYQKLTALPHIQQPIGLMTHFAEADVETADDTTHAQINLFKQLTNGLPGAKSLANSAGILRFKTLLSAINQSWVRPGLLVYGVSPLVSQTGTELGFSPVMTLASQVIAIQNVPLHGSVGYGCAWRAIRPSRVAVIAVGYGDGYPQFAPSGTPVLIHGQEFPLAGRVSMDMLTVDVTDAETTVQVGDEVELWGKRIAVERVAAHCRTSPWELLTKITQRPLLKMV